MAQNIANGKAPLASWHRNLLITGAVFSVLLIAMGGILCVTQSIRNCPDWPGCFGSFFPPSQPGPILEYTHRALAAITGLLILSSAITGLVRSPHFRWITIPPIVAVVLLVEVSYFGAQVVLRGLAPGWAAVDVGSALLVVALMVSAAVVASARVKYPQWPDRLSFKGLFAGLVLITTVMVYIVLISGILVAGNSSITACLGWPIYSLGLFQADGHGVANALRWIISLAGIALLIAVLLLAWRNRLERPALFKQAAWIGVVALLEALVQVLLLFFGHQVSILIAYTVIAAVFWALLVMLLIRVGLDEAQS
jgi:cytochrome c oxidase assembly protein subunit 15